MPRVLILLLALFALTACSRDPQIAPAGGQKVQLKSPPPPAPVSKSNPSVEVEVNDTDSSDSE